MWEATGSPREKSDPFLTLDPHYTTTYFLSLMTLDPHYVIIIISLHYYYIYNFPSQHLTFQHILTQITTLKICYAILFLPVMPNPTMSKWKIFRLYSGCNFSIIWRPQRPPTKNRKTEKSPSKPSKNIKKHLIEIYVSYNGVQPK